MMARPVALTLSQTVDKQLANAVSADGGDGDRSSHRDISPRLPALEKSRNKNPCSCSRYGMHPRGAASARALWLAERAVPRCDAQASARPANNDFRSRKLLRAATLYQRNCAFFGRQQ